MVLDLAATINPTARQKEAFAATLTSQFFLYGGAMGGGKSYFLRWWCIRECIRLFAVYGVRGVRIGLFSMDYPTLLDRQISKMVFEIPSHIGKIQKTQTDGFNLTLVDGLGGGTVALRNLDNPSKYNSAEFAGIAIEELTENPENIFHELRKRIRWPGIPANDMHFVAAANPGGIGHAWVKKLWIDRDFPHEMLQMAKQFSYVPAKAQDNPHLDPAYYEQLLSLPEEMRKAYAEGSWDIFAGQYFKEWRKDVHVVEPFEIPWHWKIERSSDWGEAAPCAHLWTATGPEGDSYVVGEVYGPGMKVSEQASKILAFEQGKNIVKIGILDSACWDVTGRAESIAEQFRKCGVVNAPSAKGPGSRVAGWNMMRQALSYERGVKAPKLRVFSTCTNLIRTLPAMVHDKLKPEDLDTGAEDHACFVAGTKISTPRGEVCIEHVCIGDMISTPLGTCKVVAAGLIGRKEVVTAAGLTGTGNHPIFAVNTMVRLDSLKRGIRLTVLGRGGFVSRSDLSASNAAKSMKRSSADEPSFVAMHVERLTGWLAAKMMSPATARRAVRIFGSIGIRVKSVAVPHAAQWSGIANVYNLATEHGCYIANGVVVSNCDALRYKFQGAADGYKVPDEELSEEDAAFRAQARKEARRG